MSGHTIILAKFGQKDYLQSIKEGKLYFNPIQKYRDDGTDFRGDKNEGEVPIDPVKISIKDQDGNDLFMDLKIPYPTKVSMTLQDDENTFIFCSAMITREVLTLKVGHNNLYVLKEDFKREIQQFGEYVLIFHSAEIIERLNKVREEYDLEFGFISGPITYRDINDFSDKGDYHVSYNTSNSAYDQYFVKDVSYINQNEWRILIDGSQNPLESNCGYGFTIAIGELDWAQLVETKIFLDTFQLIDDN